MRKSFIRLAVSFAAGAAIAYAYVLAVTTPFDRTWLPRGVLGAAVYLDTATGLVNRYLLPVGWHTGLSLMFAEGTYCFPDPFPIELRRYMRVATPVNGLTIFAVWWTSAVVRRRASTGG